LAEHTVTLKLQGSVTLKDLADAADSFAKLIAALSAHAKAKGMPWEVVDLVPGSAEVTARADIGDRFTEAQADLVVRGYRDVGRGLSQHESLTEFGPRIRTPAFALRALAVKRVESVVFETPDDDYVVSGREEGVQLGAGASGDVVAFPTAAAGSVSGRVQSLTNRGGLRFSVYDLLTDHAVSCYMAEGSEGEMVDIWGKVATVEGIVSRDPRTGRPITVRNVRRIETHPECEPDAYLQARGAVVPTATREKPEVIIRRLRDAN